MNTVYIFVAALGVAVIANFALTAHVAATLSAKMSALEHRTVDQADDSLLPVGTEIPGFSTRTVDGEPVRSWEFDRPTVLGFFMVGRVPCETTLPDFCEAAETLRVEGAEVIAVVCHESRHPGGPIADPAVKALAARLGTVARVVLERDGDAVTTAFKMTVFPAFYRVSTRNGRLRVTGTASAPPSFSGLEWA
ncbi:hypothetical protein [Streptosporangium sp. NPDC051022]|uniref:TlpA family protein disulfide reductase n=1 Tax=Streptosporangium sp. NPDC051022 TaxID=3155752 RepID=UPI0034318FD8